MTLEQWLELLRPGFPRLNVANCRLTSPADDRYNCIAWAAEDLDRWWWPDAQQQSYWPAAVARAETLDAFVQAFSMLGYSQPSNAAVELGTQKVAVFANPSGKPTHAARQVANGWWTSKLGQLVDVEHDLWALEGPAYGTVAIVLARLATAAPRP